MKKIGVYICHCGGNISDYVDVEAVKKAVETEEDVSLAKTTLFACAASNQQEMVNDIKSEGLSAVVVASCSPKLHLATFQAVTERGGLNKYCYVHANIREQASWAHSDNKLLATEKAIRLVKAAIAKVRLSQPLQPGHIQTKQAVMVIGAGISGMKAAIALANMGTQVYLVEKEHFVGGRVSQWDILCTTDETGKELVTRLYNEISTCKKITLLTGAELVSCKGSMGNFTAVIKQHPRYIRENCNSDNLAWAIEACPVSIPDEFNFNITNRKAIYHNFPSEYPHQPVIDIEHCTRCGECEKICHEIDFSQQERTLELNIGSIVVATGFDPYTPNEGEFGYGMSDRVITLPQFKRLVANCPDTLTWKGNPISTIALIYCVGSRQVNGDNKYCSRYCCTTTIYAAIKAQEKYNNLHFFHFTRGIRTYGKQETLYHQALKSGQTFLQSYEDDPPTVQIRAGRPTVTINDILTQKRTLEVGVDLVVLVTGMVPRSNSSIGDILKLPKGRDKFFNEIHMKLRPVETVIDGITIAGCSQGPKNVAESLNSAQAAAIKSYSLVSSDTIAVEPVTAEIDPMVCSWCNLCSESCPFDAIYSDDNNGKPIAKVNSAVCKGCGMCLPVCPVNAIQLKTYSDNEVEGMIDALAQNNMEQNQTEEHGY